MRLYSWQADHNYQQQQLQLQRQHSRTSSSNNNKYKSTVNQNQLMTNSRIEIIRVCVRKQDKTFGFHVVGGLDGDTFRNADDRGVFVTFVQSDGAAAGVVRKGDKILMVSKVLLLKNLFL